MTSNTSYWPTFSSSIINTPSLLVPDHTTHHISTLQQDPWTSGVDKRKWSPEFGDLDMNSNANKLFHLDDYHQQHTSEADSPDSGGVPTTRRHEDSSHQGDQKQRRKEQNRAAQRAFRERKERYVKELQQKIKEMEKKHIQDLSRLSQENDSLKQLVKQMEAEIYTLKGAAMAFNVSISKLREAGLDVQHNYNAFIRDAPSPPQSDKQSPVSKLMDEFLPKKSFTQSSAMATLRDKDGLSVSDRRSFGLTQSLFNDLLFDSPRYNKPEEEEERTKMIPCSQIWERLSQHPNFDEFDYEKLGEKLKKKSVYTMNGPVIPESELLDVLHKMDTRSL